MISEQMDAEFREVAKEIVENSPYKRKESEERTMMTVHEMGDLLGIKKTDRYWLLHKDFSKQKLYWERLGLILPALKNGMPIR